MNLARAAAVKNSNIAAVDDQLGLWWDQPIERGLQDSRDHESKRFRAVGCLPPYRLLRPAARGLHGLPREGMQD
jgi:hypothetical protein